jgi:hypothetical protein
MNQKRKHRTSAFTLAHPAAVLVLVLAGVIFGLSIAHAASITAPTYTRVADSSTNPPNYDLNVTGTQDWQVYEGGFTTPIHKQNGNSITLTTPVTVVSPCTTEVLGPTSRSHATFNWNGGTPTDLAIGHDASDSGFKFQATNTVGYGVNYEKFTFVPGDTNRHTVHLYGYFAGAALLNPQFSNSLAGAASTTTNPPTQLGDFDYSVTFKADHTNDALTVIFTFSKTSTSGSIATAGINAVAMDGTVPVSQVNWRVIADDTNCPASDTVVAGVVIGDLNFTNTLPADTTNNDCSAYFQEAMNWLSDKGGGTVFAPAGHYMFTNNLDVPVGVVLRGRWVQPGPGQPVTNCTIFDICVNSNLPPILEDKDTNAFISIGSDCGLRDLTFWYPNQNPTNPVPYPYTVWGRSTKNIENVTLVNSYAGLDLDASGLTCVRGVYGTTLEMGVRYQNGQAVPRAEALNLSPDYWSWSGLPGSPTNATTKAILAGLMLNNTNCIGMEAENVDCFFVQNVVISGYCYGVQLTSNGDNPGQPEFYNVVATNCTEGLRLQSAKSLQAINCTFGGTTNGYGVHRLSQAAGNYFGCTIYGGAGAILCGSGGLYYNLILQGCTLSNSVTLGYHYELVLVGSTFLSTGTNVYLNTGSGNPRQAVIAGNVNCGPANVVQYGKGDQVVISTNPVAPITVPFFPVDYPRTRKAGRTNLFNVLSFGAKGDGVTNDTAAVQAAIASANSNQGGIVFFPAGVYNLTQSLSVSNGVELRGIWGGRHENTDLPGSQLDITANAGTSNGPAFITLYGQSGIRGFNLLYPDQDAHLQTPYPYMIQCSGASNYVVDLCCGSDYQGVDLNGAKTALVEYCLFGGLENIFRIRGGSTDCRIQNCHAKPESWWGNGHASNDEIASSQENTFVVEDCTNLTINSIFNHQAHTLFTQRGGTGQALIVNGEGLQRGYVFESAPANGVFNFMGCNSLVYASGDGTDQFCWWLQSNYVGTVSVLNSFCNNLWANYTFRVDNANACLILNSPKPGGQQQLLPTFRAVGKVLINAGLLDSDFTVDVPAGGQLVISNSVLNNMPYAPQPGYQGWSNNCIIQGNSFIAANTANDPPVADGISLITNNLATEWAGNFGYGWHLVNGNTNFLLDVTAPAFANGLKPNVTIQIIYYENSDGNLSLWYDSTNGMKLGATYTLYSTNSQWVNRSLAVTDARFSGTNDIMLTVDSTNCDPVLRLVRVDTASYLGVPPQLLPPPPVAGFTATPTNGIRPLAVTFSDTSTGSITNLLWNFGDSQTTNTAAGAVVPHTYKTNGTYTVSLKASGAGGGNTNTQIGLVTVLIPNPPKITSIQPVGTSALVLQGAGGPTNGGYYYWLCSSTNLSLPLTNWLIVATNPFDVYGNFSNQIPVTPSSPQTFYRIQMP